MDYMYAERHVPYPLTFEVCLLGQCFARREAFKNVPCCLSVNKPVAFECIIKITICCCTAEQVHCILDLRSSDLSSKMHC